MQVTHIQAQSPDGTVKSVGFAVNKATAVKSLQISYSRVPSARWSVANDHVTMHFDDRDYTDADSSPAKAVHTRFLVFWLTTVEAMEVPDYL